MNETQESKFSNIAIHNEIKITDILISDIVGAPMHCILVKVLTNKGIIGYGEVRDGASRNFLLALKSRLIGENPMNVEKLFNRVKQFGHHARQGGGVSAIEIALWDIVGKVYEIPIYQMLGGKYRDKIRMYCDTDIEGKHSGVAMGEALQKRLDRGFTFLKMDLGIDLLFEVEGSLNAPLGMVEELIEASAYDPKLRLVSKEDRKRRNRFYDIQNIAHAFTGVQITELGLDYLEKYVKEVRSIIGYQVPLAVDHLGHIGVGPCIQLAKRLEKYNIAWIEDPIPWQSVNDYIKLSNSTSVPICTGEDIYLCENFKPIIDSGAIKVVHPDVLSTGGIMETKRIADYAESKDVAMAIHMAESPIACLAAAHVAAASNNFLALEFHSNDVPWWNDIASGIPNPLIKDGFIHLSDAPGLGIESLNDEVISAHLHPDYPILWDDGGDWNNDYSHDRIWS